MTEETVIKLRQFEDNKPIAEIEHKLRLGTLIRRYRVQSGKSLRDVSDVLDITPTVLGEVERGLAVLQAGKLQDLARYLDVRYEPLLDATRDWHGAVWNDEDDGKGVVLSDMKMATRTMHPLRADESELELELIRTADELVFLSNVSREISIRAERAAVNARELLEKRGMMIPEPPPIEGPEEVQCAGPSHHEKLPVRLRRGKDFVLAFVPEDGGETVYFCSKRCGDEWRAQQAEMKETETP